MLITGEYFRSVIGYYAVADFTSTSVTAHEISNNILSATTVTTLVYHFILDNYVVVSSGKDIVHDLKNLVSSFYIIQEKDGWVKPPKMEYEKKVVRSVKQVNLCRTCMFQKNEICRNSRSVNYGYECEKPFSCARFKASN